MVERLLWMSASEASGEECGDALSIVGPVLLEVSSGRVSSRFGGTHGGSDALEVPRKTRDDWLWEAECPLPSCLSPNLGTLLSVFRAADVSSDGPTRVLRFADVSGGFAFATPVTPPRSAVGRRPRAEVGSVCV